MNKKYNILLSETLSGTLEVEAKSILDAEKKVLAMINHGRPEPIPEGIMNETGGYKIEDIQLAPTWMDNPALKRVRGWSKSTHKEIIELIKTLKND